MITIDRIHLQRGGKTLLEDASLKIHYGQRIALIGVNGCGKSSLFQLILGNIQCDGGSIDIPDRLRMAYMAQEIADIDRPAREYIIDGHHELRALEFALQEAETRDDHAKMAELHAKLDEIAAYNVRHQAETIMLGLGFQPQDYERKVSSFSGGWRIRLSLARTLISPSDLLLLDEPTNHLDMEAIHWLEEWLQRYPGSVLLISHDRDFIDATAAFIAHIEECQIHLYRGSYSDFERQRAERIALQQSQHEKQQRRRAELQSFIDRFRAKATKAKQAQSRIKALERMQLVSAVREKSVYHFRIPCYEKNGSPMVNWFQVCAGYPDKPVLEGCTFSIQPGMRIGLLGVNGAGKSTLIKTLCGELPTLSGEAVVSEHLRIGYFAQHQLESLDCDASPILQIQRLSPTVREQEIRDFLGSYRIQGDMAMNPIHHFSGGEKARLALAMVAWQKPNLLLLDEPTNHLDIEMREALVEALQAFEGAVILVSHDRYLLRHCVDQFWLVEKGRVALFDGELDDYYEWRKRNDSAVTAGEEAGPVVDSRKQTRQDAAQRRAMLAPVKKAIKMLEKRMEEGQKRLDALREQLADPAIYGESGKKNLATLLAEESSLKAELERWEEEWYHEQEKLQELEAAS